MDDEIERLRSVLSHAHEKGESGIRRALRRLLTPIRFRSAKKPSTGRIEMPEQRNKLNKNSKDAA
jgi:hypothetical protein